MADKALPAVEDMTAEELNEAVYEKMAEEQRLFRAYLLSRTAEEALNHAYEYTVREDIVMCMEEDVLSARQAGAMLRSPCPLADVYKDWKKQEYSDHMERIRESICDRANKFLSSDQPAQDEEDGQHMDIQELLQRDDRFRYMLLGRMKADCEYYLGNGMRFAKHLWALDERRHIDIMKALWNSFPAGSRPEWLAYEEILDYEKRMIQGG